jgi:glycerol-3-phosphate acyltransferase PlsY
MPTALAMLAAYLLGCFNSGYYLVRFRAGQDIRTLASGGTGSRNVGRLLGAKGFVITFIGDAGKGVLAVWLGGYLGLAQWQLLALLLVVVVGHIFPVQLGFRGGKGFATLAGGLLLLAPCLLLAGFLLSVMFLSIVQRTTMAGLLGLACSPLLMALDLHRHDQPWLESGFIIYLILVILILYAHRSNIRDYLQSKRELPEV